MYEYGKISNVYITNNGSDLEVASIAGATEIILTDAFDFDELDGVLSIEGDVYPYSHVDMDTDTAYLTLATTADYPRGTAVRSWPYGTTKYAMIQFDDGDEGIEAVVPVSMYDRVADGIREDMEQESCVVSDSAGRWVISSIDGETPVIDGGFTDPDTVPTGPTMDQVRAGFTLNGPIDTDALMSGVPVFELDGSDGSGHVGEFAWGTDGRATRLSTSVSPNSPYLGGIDLYRVGPMVFAAGFFSRPSGAGTGYVTVGNIPSGFRPVVALTSPALFIYADVVTQWQYVIQTNGDIDIRMSAVNTDEMYMNLFWIAA